MCKEKPYILDVLCGCYVVAHTRMVSEGLTIPCCVHVFLQACKPGVTLNYLHSAAVEMLVSELKGKICPSTNTQHAGL